MQAIMKPSNRRLLSIRHIAFWMTLAAACGDGSDGTMMPDSAERQSAGGMLSPDAHGDAAADAASHPACEWGGAPGICIGTSACTALADHTAKTGMCAAGLVCCIVTPSVSDNPPTPMGYKLMKQADVTPAMTSWAVMILHDPVTYPMFATTKKTFGALNVLARVEWHPPDFQNHIVHRGVTLYEPI
jgi:hypothetical protein